MHDTEVLFLRMLPPYLRTLTKQKGHFLKAIRVKELKENQVAEFVSRKVPKKRGKKSW